MTKHLLPLILLLFSTTVFAQSFNSIWNTANVGTGSSADNEITIPTNPAYTTYNYTVDWGDGDSDTAVTGDITHSYTSPGTYTITISGDFPSIYFNDAGDKLKIIEILQWGDIQWQTMEDAFHGCENLNFDAIDEPDLSQATTLKNMFRDCTSFNGIINNWNVSSITDISAMFYNARAFNRPLDLWTTGGITDMSETFYGAARFNEPLDNWNTRAVTTIARMFDNARDFNQNINNWNVSFVTDMSGTFSDASDFNGPLNNWDVGNVTDMSYMFDDSGFDRPIGNWNVSSVTNMSHMFSNAVFNQPIDAWNVSSVTDMSFMFQRHRTFDQPLNSWNVGNVTNMSSMFDGYFWNNVFNQPLSNWDVGQVTDMSNMFRDTPNFNQDIGGWNVSEVTDMSGMFNQADSFNQDISAWNVGKVTNMSGMFNQAIVFNNPLDSWNVSSVTNMSGMFQSASLFNQALNSWNVGQVTNMNRMFRLNPVFDQALNNWNTAAVTTMSGMFENAGAFDRNLASWNITGVTTMATILSNSGLSQENYDDTLVGWSAQAVSTNVNLGANNLTYCDALNERQQLIDNHNWNIGGDSVNCSFVLCTDVISPYDGDQNVPANSSIRWNAAPNATGYRISIRREDDAGNVLQVIFADEDIGNVLLVNFTNEFLVGDNVFVTVVPYNDEGPAVGCEEISFKTVASWVNSPDAFKLTYDTQLQEGSQTTPINRLKIQVKSGFTYDYSIDWGDGQYDNNVTGQIVHTYLNPGIYTVSIIGTFPAPRHEEFNSDSFKLLSIDQWGTQAWQTMQGAFAGCENMEYNATDVPDLTGVTDMSRMFIVCRKFNGNINSWDVGNVTNMYGMFAVADIFDQALNNWDVSNVTNMSLMFFGTDTFNQNINSWDTSKVTTTERMFENTDAFNSPINNWDVSSVTTMEQMFQRTEVFNQPLNNWDVSMVTNMEEMFYQAKAFNQNIDSWNVSAVTTMESMFTLATVFDQPLNSWNVSNVVDMGSMFRSATAFNQPLGSWNVSSVVNMGSMFQLAVNFNQNIDSWNVSAVTNMSSMFEHATVFNRPLQSWNVSRVISMQSMFDSAIAFDRPLENWDVNSVVNMSSMFESAEAFNQPLNPWDVSAVANTSSMFKNALLFDQELNQWDVSSVTLMPSMFEGAAAFNGLTSNWDVASVTDMEAMFKDAIVFDRPLNNWDTGEVLTMEEMFSGASAFNRLIDNWDTSFVTTMESMFEDAIAYDRPMTSWNVASVATMEKMFKGATAFNGDVGTWNVRGVDTMEEMFRSATAFNQNLNDWRLAGVGNMISMFEDATAYNQPMDQWDLGNVNMRSTFENASALNQHLGDWDVSSVNDMRDMLDNTALTRENYDNTLIAWSEQTLTSGISLGAQGLPYCDALEERQSMIDTYGWTISGDMLDCPIPVCTQLTSPLNLDTDVPVNTNLTWEPAQYARGYRLTVGTSAGGNDVVNNETITDETSYEFASDFNTGDTVFVTLVPFNDTGDAVGTCAEESFTISADPATIPDCTNLITPLADASDVPVTTDLSWDPISNADGYRLTVGTTSGASDIVNNQDVGNVTTFEFAADLPEDTDIFVTIVPYNDEGSATTCSEEIFTTELIPVPPVCTTLTDPANGATDVPIDTSLSWTSISDATGYLVTVGTTSGGVETVNNVDVGNETTYDLPDNLLESRTYYVTIIPYNDEGDASGCTEESFTTGDSTSPPSCVTLSTPVSGATRVAPDTDLSWNTSGTATGYRLTVGTTAGGTDIFTGDVGDVTTHDLSADLPESTLIYVSVTAYNDNGDATGCTEESFTTNGPPSCTSLTTPANGATDIAVDTDIAWNAATNADGYRLTVMASSSTVNNLTNFDVTGTTYDFPNDFEQGETVTVTIVPYNAIGDATGCNPESFTIVPPPLPLCTALITPSDGATEVTANTSIEWIASSGANGYKLTVAASSSTANNLTDFDITSGTIHDFPNDFEQGETVTVTLVPYNETGDAIGCTSESFTIKPVPVCTNLVAPADGAVDVAVDTDIEWTSIADATGYKLTINASNSTSNNVTELDITSGNTYNCPNNFEQGEAVTVTIVPYNEVGDAIACSSESFTIKSVPACTNLIAPADQAFDIAVDTDIEWQPIAGADGYRLTVSASSSTANNVTDLVVSTGTSYNFPADFEQGETVTVSVVPYNEVGDALGCTPESFTIKSVPSCTNLILPMDGDVIVSADEIRWNGIADANGYKLTIDGSNSAANDVSDLEITGTSYTFPNDFDEGEVITVTITPYNEVGDAVGCASESFTIRPLPLCTQLITPLNGATEVDVATDLQWNVSEDADGYRISVGTSSNGTDVVNNEDVASLTSYTFAQDLDSETMFYVSIVPYNTSGDALGCTSENFETEVIVPECTSVVSPATGETDVPLESIITWEEVEKTDGYRISLGTTSGGTDIVNNQNVGQSTRYVHGSEFPYGIQIFVSITPYNSKGDAVDCQESSFTTLTPEDDTKYGFSPDGDGINEYWHIDNIEYYPENTVVIYNRWGDLVFQIDNYDNASNVFRGEANRMTQLGADNLPSGTYFFMIQVPDDNILKKTKGYVVIKR